MKMDRVLTLSLLLVMVASTTASAQLFRRGGGYSSSNTESRRVSTVALGEELEGPSEAYKRLWDRDLELAFDKLPTEGSVPEWRIPYSGFDYADTAGGTNYGLNGSPMAKYDRAFNGGRGRASGWEASDTTFPSARDMRDRARAQGRRAGLFAGSRLVREARGWYGHCNARTAASIRHAEPEKNVERNGVTFTPADIKALLCDIYMWSDTEVLAGDYSTVTAPMLHIMLTNWLGRGQHPVGMDDTPGEQTWNFPIYGYEITHNEKLSNRRVEIVMDITYAKPNMSEQDKSPRVTGEKRFHYFLDLDSSGKIVGGNFYGDSSIIDLLWVPMQPGQGGQEGNKDGNPHINTKEVLAIWRDSVSEDVRKKWFNADPVEEDRVAQADSSEEPADAETATAEEAATEEAAAEVAENTADGSDRE